MVRGNDLLRGRGVREGAGAERSVAPERHAFRAAALSALPRVDFEAMVAACRRLTGEEAREAFTLRLLPLFWSPYAASYAVASEQALALARARGLTVVARMHPADLTRALQAVFGEQICGQAVGALARSRPRLSARTRLTVGQAIAGAAALAGAGALWIASPWLAAWILGGVFSLLFLSVAMLRLMCLLSRVDRSPGPPDLPDAELPVYTVLVPLYRETEVIAQLVRSLRALDYPAERLDVKIILEASDPDTLRHAETLKLPEHFELLVVPDRFPRTKPKALNYGLGFARGSLLTIYDAEDVPSPDQLRLAAATFAASPPDVVCLQAPLAFYNASETRLTRQMAIEYAVLYDLLLPVLTRSNLPVPLGGTSNHFRVSALRALEGWDPYNVTEDADLGLRLARFGWRVKMIASPTLEEAPCRSRVWMMQRVRWLKGWMQTTIDPTRSIKNDYISDS